MSTLTIGDGGFLAEVNEVKLDASFGTTLTQAINTINNNFKKLISVPFLKGAHGENIQVYEIPLDDGSKFTKLGEVLCNEIYGTTSYDYWDVALDDEFGGQYWQKEAPDGELDPLTTHSYDMYDHGYTVPFYGYIERTEDKEKLVVTSQQMFMFFDSRLKEIREIKKDWKKFFVDLSSAYIITGEVEIDKDSGDILYDPDSETTFTVTKCSVIPTLYYDNTIGIEEWCWKLNGVETQISAQGQKGDAGHDANCVVCYGTKNAGTPLSITIEQVLTPTEDDPDDWDWSTNAVGDLYGGQLAIVWYQEGNSMNCTFGPVSGDTEKKVFVGHVPGSTGINFDVRTMLDNISLRDLMNDITSTESTSNVTASQTACRGLWIPDTFTSSPEDSDPSTIGDVHMFWSESNGSKSAHLGAIDYQDTYGNSNPPMDPKEDAIATDQSKFSFHYDTVKKDFIELKRRDLIPQYTEYTTFLDDAKINEYVSIAKNTSTTGITQATQAITIKANANDEKKVALTSKGLYLVGKLSDRIRSTEVNSEKVVMTSNIQIGNSTIGISGKNAPSSKLCPLTSSSNRENLRVANNMIIHNQNVLVSNSSLLIGTNMVTDKFNAYVQHFGNYTIYNYDYVPLLDTYSSGSSKYFYSDTRPRKLAFVPVSIGGWLSLYSSVTNNYSKYTTKMTEPIELTLDDNFKHTFLSGKFGSTGTIITENFSSIDNATNKADFNVIKEYTNIGLQDVNNPYKYGMCVSMSGIWTKIGNVVDVKGKIFVSGAKIEIINSGDTYTATIQEVYPVSYSSMYDFIMKNHDSIKFPLPVILKNGTSPYVSTGNVFTNTSAVVQNITKDSSSYDNHFGNRPYGNKITSTTLASNDILNGSAKIHFFGNTENVFKNYNYWDLGVSLVPSSGIEATPNIFDCSAGLKIKGKKYWGFTSLPIPEIKDHTDTIPSKYGNDTGPVRFAKYGNANNTSYSCNHTYQIATPRMYGYYDNNQDSANDPNAKELFIATTISPYIVRYLTFNFSYLLDDDVYGATVALNKNGESQDYDTEAWPVLNASPIINSGWDEVSSVTYTNNSGSGFEVDPLTPGGSGNSGSSSNPLNNNNNSEENNNSPVSNTDNTTLYWRTTNNQLGRVDIDASLTPSVGYNSNYTTRGTQELQGTIINNSSYLYLILRCQFNTVMEDNNPQYVFDEIDNIEIYRTQTARDTALNSKTSDNTVHYKPLRVTCGVSTQVEISSL